jgi:hypothetical protein
MTVIEESPGGESPPTAPALEPGAHVSLCEALDGAVAAADIVSVEPDGWTLRGDVEGLGRDGGVYLRSVDDDGQAWGVPVRLERPAGSAGVHAAPIGAWEPLLARGAVRIASRVTVVATPETGDTAPSRQYVLAVVDVSTTGCRALLVGRVPEIGAMLVLRPEGHEAWTLRARVSRRTAGAFGRAEIGLRFELRTPADREAARGWRDGVAFAGRAGVAA